MNPVHHVGLVVMAAVWLGCAVLLARSGVRRGAVLLAAAAVTIGVGVALEGVDGVALAAQLTAGLVLGPLAVLAYPRPGTLSRHVDRAAGALLVLAAGVAAAVPEHAGIVPAAAGVIGLVIVHLWWRFERLTPDGRRPLVWLVIGLGVPAVVAFATSIVVEGTPTTQALTLVALGVPAVCMVVGVRRPDVVDARGIVVEATVVGVTWTACLALYVTVASTLALTTGTDPAVGVQAIVACCCAVAYRPLRRLLHSTVDELLFGRRPDPLAAAARVAGGPLTDPGDVLARIREALVLPYAAIHAAGADVACSGDPTPHVRRFPLDHAEDDLVVGLRPGDLQLSRADAEVLALVARLLGQTRRAEALAAELSQSRAAIRGAVEEERRRLRRELHDGLGPTLAGIAFTVDAVTNLAAGGSEQVAELLRLLRREASRAIDDIRRIVYDIRPPTLDQLGLRGAIAQQAHVLRRADLEIVLQVGPDADELPAAAEVAAYRIVTEALTNAARHTASRTVTVTVTREGDDLQVAVTDDDAGSVDREWVPGIGLTSMQERAEELGGRLLAGPTPSGGRVVALLPLG
ncbi:sensor histidine kinase [Georgenia ruanii]|nr:histidine kinase [Georgenia ruanii]MPV88048.1 hypothetical protein [Georgenia ruanii]